jgi:hypothetical protein
MKNTNQEILILNQNKINKYLVQLKKKTINNN